MLASDTILTRLLQHHYCHRIQAERARKLMAALIAPHAQYGADVGSRNACRRTAQDATFSPKNDALEF